jgi:hypothetical protein
MAACRRPTPGAAAPLPRGAAVSPTDLARKVELDGQACWSLPVHFGVLVSFHRRKVRTNQEQETTTTSQSITV